MTAAILLALAPVALLVALGYGLRHTGFIADVFWPQAERLCYYILLPALFMHGLASAHLQALPERVYGTMNNEVLLAVSNKSREHIREYINKLSGLLKALSTLILGGCVIWVFAALFSLSDKLAAMGASGSF